MKSIEALVYFFEMISGDFRSCRMINMDDRFFADPIVPAQSEEQ